MYFESQLALGQFRSMRSLTKDRCKGSIEGASLDAPEVGVDDRARHMMDLQWMRCCYEMLKKKLLSCEFYRQPGSPTGTNGVVSSACLISMFFVATVHVRHHAPTEVQLTFDSDSDWKSFR